MTDEDEAYAFTEEGLLLALAMHEKAVEGWTLQSIADYYDYPNVEYIRIILAMFYHAADSANIDLVVDVPPNLEGIV